MFSIFWRLIPDGGERVRSTRRAGDSHPMYVSSHAAGPRNACSCGSPLWAFALLRRYIIEEVRHCCGEFRSLDMKVSLLMATASAVLFLVPRPASADGMTNPSGANPPAGSLMQHANESAQATTDMSLSEPGAPNAQSVQTVSYGGAAPGRTQSGGRQEMPCSTGPQCRIYFGQ